jgi:hypothetical protein
LFTTFQISAKTFGVEDYWASVQPKKGGHIKGEKKLPMPMKMEANCYGAKSKQLNLFF